MAGVVKRRIQPEAISVPNGQGQSQFGNLQSLGVAPGRVSGNLKRLSPEEEAKAAREAGLVGRRLYVRLNAGTATNVSWKKVYIAVCQPFIHYVPQTHFQKGLYFPGQWRAS